VTVPNPANIHEWHYCIYGLKDCPLEGGFYHGKLIFPKDYPFKPPSILMITPNGRFKPMKRICMTMSDYHPEQWNPIWSVETIITGLVSFFNSNE
jgi:ubiquitin-conjugating enzyme E2 J2